MKVLWFVSSLEQKGGGERFVQEAALALRASGHVVVVVCDRLNLAASFDGHYDLSEVICTKQELKFKSGYAAKAFSKFRGILCLGSTVRYHKPQLVICQSEFDAIKLYLLSRLLRFRYRVFVFGQMYQFKTDISRYSKIFRRHLNTIIASRPGYSETVIMPPPRLSLGVSLVNNIVSCLKYRALRKADRIFTVSNQVQWEVSIVYGCHSVVCRAAFDENYIDAQSIEHPRPLGRPIGLLSVSRLVDKKRIDLIIAAFAACKLDATLTIIGTGPEEARLKELGQGSSRAPQIIFLGPVSDITLQREISKADCFISMDIGDYDITVMEAMGKGLRAIVAADFDMTEFGDKFGGIVSVYPDIESVKVAIENIPYMAPPCASNITILKRLTWGSLARTCISD